MTDRATGIDPRGPRVAAAITAALLLVALFLSLTGLSTRTGAAFGWFAYQPLADAVFAPQSTGLEGASLWQRAADPGFLALAVVAALFLWSVLSPATAPWGALYRRVIRPRLAPPRELEDPRPPRFAQGVGLAVTAIGLVLHLAGVPWALPVAAGAALVAAFLNAAFGLCLGCLMYLALKRWGLGRSSPA